MAGVPASEEKIFPAGKACDAPRTNPPPIVPMFFRKLRLSIRPSPRKEPMSIPARGSRSYNFRNIHSFVYGAASPMRTPFALVTNRQSLGL